MTLDDVKKLQQKKYRQALGCFLLEGEHLAQELEAAAERHGHWQQAKLYVTEAYADWPTRLPKQLISQKQLHAICDTQHPQGIVAVVPLPPTSQAPVGQRALYLHEVQDPGNLGTIMRTLAWFGGFRLLLSPGSVDPFNPKVVRASMGAVLHLPIEQEVAISELTARYPRLAYLDMQGEPLASASFAKADCYLFGNEARGVPRAALAALKAQPYNIAGCGAIESLNLASVVSMSLYELHR